jgi:hypothetical protein
MLQHKNDHAHTRAPDLSRWYHTTADALITKALVRKASCTLCTPRATHINRVHKHVPATTVRRVHKCPLAHMAFLYDVGWCPAARPHLALQGRSRAAMPLEATQRLLPIHGNPLHMTCQSKNTNNTSKTAHQHSVCAGAVSRHTPLTAVWLHGMLDGGPERPKVAHDHCSLFCSDVPATCLVTQAVVAPRCQLFITVLPCPVGV